MDGIELIRRVRNDTSLPSVGLLIICVTAHAVRPMVDAAIRNGADGFLVKPISAKDLYTCLAQHSENPLPRISLRGYFGPDRRRNPDPSYEGVERRLAEIDLSPDACNPMVQEHT
jgi:DNA-binding response OmpR family regulator